jgi:hypothetical protein
MPTVTVQLQLDAETAARLTDPRQLAAVTELVKHAVRPTTEHDPLALLLLQTRRDATAAGLTDEDIDAELAAWKAERAAGLG